MQNQSLFEEILGKGIQEKQKEFRKLVIRELRGKIEILFTETNDVKLIHKKLLEMCDTFELENYALYNNLYIGG